MDGTPVPEEPHTLENFSIQHFNSLPKRTLSKALANTLRKRERDFPWSFSKVEYWLWYLRSEPGKTSNLPPAATSLPIAFLIIQPRCEVSHLVPQFSSC